MRREKRRSRPLRRATDAVIVELVPGRDPSHDDGAGRSRQRDRRVDRVVVAGDLDGRVHAAPTGRVGAGPRVRRRRRRARRPPRGRSPPRHGAAAGPWRPRSWRPPPGQAGPAAARSARSRTRPPCRRAGRAPGAARGWRRPAARAWRPPRRRSCRAGARGWPAARRSARASPRPWSSGRGTGRSGRGGRGPARRSRTLRTGPTGRSRRAAPPAGPSAITPGGLVAEDERTREDGVADPGLVVPVKVGAADADRRHADQRLARAGDRGGLVREPEVAGAVEAERLHRAGPSRPRRPPQRAAPPRPPASSARRGEPPPPPGSRSRAPRGGSSPSRGAAGRPRSCRPTCGPRPPRARPRRPPCR